MPTARKLPGNTAGLTPNDITNRFKTVLKEVYRHALPEVQKKMENTALKYFEKMQHKTR